MKERRIFGVFLIFFSLLLFLISFFYADITGGSIGIKENHYLLKFLSIVLFFVGIGILVSLEKKILNMAKTIALIGGIAYGGQKLKKAEDEYYNKEKKEPKIERIAEDNYTNKNIKEDTANLNLSKINYDIKKRIEKTMRWDEILDKTEERYGIPRGLLKGLAMQESYGDPLKLNEGDDGGAGLFMLMPGTAQEFGLKVFENSKRVSADKEYGKRLRKLVKKLNHDYSKLSEIDERFNVIKSSDVAAKYLKKLYKKYNSWDKALSAYNRGPNNVAENPLKTPHVKKVREFQEYYNKFDKD